MALVTDTEGARSAACAVYAGEEWCEVARVGVRGWCEERRRGGSRAAVCVERLFSRSTRACIWRACARDIAAGLVVWSELGVRTGECVVCEGESVRATPDLLCVCA